MGEEQDNVAVEHFKQYLRIPSVQPDCDYSACVKWLQGRAQSMGLPCNITWVDPGKPVVVITWEGTRPEAPSLLLSSHMDVVPVFPEMWTYPPFSAEEDDEGNIYARGAQDMKCVAVQYLEAVHRLILKGFRPNRTVHLCFTPDEELGSLGMKSFVQTKEFEILNVGCELDEGVASPDKYFNLYYGERTAYDITIICPGTPGHGSLLHDNTAGEKIAFVINKFMEKRAKEKKKLEDNPNLTLGDVTSVNLTILRGGVQTNVVPPELRVAFDVRVTLNTNNDKFEQWVENVCKQAGDGVRVEYNHKKKRVEPTKVDSTNPWWIAMKRQFDKMGVMVKPQIFPAATDARFIRGLGIPAFGFSPMNNTPVKLHDHDEFLNRKVFLRGIEIYVNLISGMASI